MKFKKTISILIILIVCLVNLTGCYSSANLETFAYAVAIGIDKGVRKYNKTQLATCNFK